MTLSAAIEKAEELRSAFDPFCVPNTLMVVGSVRRRSPEPHDIELVGIPDLTDYAKANGITSLLKSGRFGRVDSGMFPSRYTKLVGSMCNIDLFWCDSTTVGLNTFIRTGNAAYVTAGLAYWKKLTNGGYADGARLFLADGTLVPTPDEHSVFKALKCRWVPPEKRTR